MSIFRRHLAGGLNPPATNRIAATYNVTSTSSATQLLGSSSSFNLDLVSLMFIDGKYTTPTKTYTFSTTGNHTVVFGFKSITSCTYMFSGCTTLTSIDLSGFDAKDVTTMSFMFYNCSQLTSVSFYSNLYSPSLGYGGGWLNMLKVTTTAHMFRGCTALTTVEGLGDVFMEDYGVNTNCSYMFYGCSSLASINLDYFVVPTITALNHMFYGCGKLTSVITTNWEASGVTTIAQMFRGCTSLTDVGDVGGLGWGFSASLTDISYLFQGCTSLKSALYCYNFIKSGVTTMAYLFHNCTSLTTIGLGNCVTTACTTMNHVFYNCGKLTSIDISSWNCKKVTTMASMFANCTSLTSIKVGGTSSIEYYPTSGPTRTSILSGITTTGTISIPNRSAAYTGWQGSVFTGYIPDTWSYTYY